MRFQPTKTREKLPSRLALLAPLALCAAVFACLALGARTLLAGGGGDAIGSLPCAPLPPPESMLGEPKPSIVLEGPSLAAVKALVIDAYGDGYFQVLNLPEGGVRVEVQGRVTVVLDRNGLGVLGVSTGLDVSQGFSSGLGVLIQNQRPVRTQILPAQGDLDLPLQALAASGALDSGILTLRSVSLTHQHHQLEMSCSGGTVRLASGN